MDSMPPFRSEDFDDIPPFFYSITNKKPFSNCSICDVSLDNKHYIIEKLVQKDEPIVEFCLCIKCIEGLKASLSKESLEKLNKEEKDLPSFFYPAKCLYCGLPEKEVKRSLHVGMFIGKKYLIDSHLWSCNECIKKRQSNLSKLTRERLEDFNRDILSPYSSNLDLDLMPFG